MLSFFCGGHSESAFLISLAATLLVFDLWSLFGKVLGRSLDCGSELLLFILVSLFCCLMVLFLRSRREKVRWPDWGLTSFWIIQILKTTPVGSQGWLNMILVWCFAFDLLIPAGVHPGERRIRHKFHSTSHLADCLWHVIPLLASLSRYSYSTFFSHSELAFVVTV